MFILPNYSWNIIGPNDFEAFNCLVAAFSSGMEKEEVFISKVSDTGTLGRDALSGTLALLPRRFWKCVDQLSKRFLADPTLILTDEFLPERSLMVFQARWSFLLMCSSESLLILPLLKSTSAFKQVSSRFFLALISWIFID